MMFWVGTLTAGAADSGKSTDEAYLDSLQGTWRIEGTVGDKPVRYIADGHRVLRGGFLRLHMMEPDSKSPYEAEVFIGFDPDQCVRSQLSIFLQRANDEGAEVYIPKLSKRWHTTNCCAASPPRVSSDCEAAETHSRKNNFQVTAEFARTARTATR